MATFKRANNCLNCPYRSGSFTVLTTEEKLSIQRNCLIATFKKGENIVKQGEKPTSAIYIAKGMVKVYIHNDNKSLILRLFKSGEYVALSTVFDKTNYSFSITAVEESRICMVDSMLFKLLAKNNSNFMTSLAEQMAFENNEILQRLLFLNRKNVRSKLAETLLFLADKLYESDDFELTLTRKELGEMIGLTREHTTRLLAEFQKEKVIDIDKKRIKILNREVLEHIKNFY